MANSFQDIIEEMEGLSLHDLYRVEQYLLDKTNEPSKVKEVKRQLRPGQSVRYFDREENRLIEAEVLTLKRSRLLVKNFHDGRKWNILYASVCLESEPQVLRPQKGKLTKTDVQIGQIVSFYDNDDQEQIGTIIKLNPKRAKVKLETGITWNVYYQSLSLVVDGEVTDEKFIDIKLIE